MNIVILGPPGSGKGTQARILGDIYALDVVDTGRLLRVSLSSDIEIMKYINEGNLLSDDLVVKIVRHHIIALNSDFILDGFPRTLIQARALIDFLNDTDKSLKCVIKMIVDDDSVISRLSTRFICSDCGAIFGCFIQDCDHCKSKNIEKRTDDESISAVKLRIAKYKQEMSALEDFFKNNNINFLSIDASRSIADVTKDIQNKLI